MEMIGIPHTYEAVLAEIRADPYDLLFPRVVNLLDNTRVGRPERAAGHLRQNTAGKEASAGGVSRDLQDTYESYGVWINSPSTSWIH